MTGASIQDRCRGVLLGLAAGDRIGGPLQMAMRLAESLIACRGFEPADVLERYLSWWKDDGFDTGPVSDRVFQLIAGGLKPSEAVEQVHCEFRGRTAGCNPAHRVAPLAMCAAIPDEALCAFARADARLTHFDPLAGDVAAAAASLCRALVRGRSWQEARSASSEFAGERELPREGGYAPDVFEAAIHFVSASPDFDNALERSFAFAKAANYCPVLVGVIAGACWGASAIPSHAVKHVRDLGSVIETANALSVEW